MLAQTREVIVSAVTIAIMTLFLLAGGPPGYDPGRVGHCCLRLLRWDRTVLAVTGGTYLALTTIEGQIVQPLFVGQRLELNPIIVFLALWIGGWFWGIAGIVFAVPSLVALKVVAEHSDQGTPLLEFLSPNRTKRFKPRRGTSRKASGSDLTSAAKHS